ncbi:hypothetical protein [Halopseudomonas salegens]|uniref:Uncharacterized protein n=1 Tax=Halopseudomonas salegens TaxID=1434072 RepID=A0A1H2G9Y7_9GAMM|nr:hypothetical protein [Halopseudomonas salegens]SDU16329.1 hypothetical protein SAMN05216210_2145 [Halopseudomonas salegens]
MKLIINLIPVCLLWIVFWLTIGADHLALIPPLALFYLLSSIEFLWIPLFISGFSSIALILLIRHIKLHLAIKYFIASSTFIVLFLFSGEALLESRISHLLPEPKPECIIRESFIDALINLEGFYGHTAFAHDGHIFRWSYTQNDFYKSPTLLRNFPCTPEHEEYWANIKKSW